MRERPAREADRGLISSPFGEGSGFYSWEKSPNTGPYWTQTINVPFSVKQATLDVPLQGGVSMQDLPYSIGFR